MNLKKKGYLTKKNEMVAICGLGGPKMTKKGQKQPKMSKNISEVYCRELWRHFVAYCVCNMIERILLNNHFIDMTIFGGSR